MDGRRMDGFALRQAALEAAMRTRPDEVPGTLIERARTIAEFLEDPKDKPDGPRDDRDAVISFYRAAIRAIDRMMRRGISVRHTGLDAEAPDPPRSWEEAAIRLSQLLVHISTERKEP